MELQRNLEDPGVLIKTLYGGFNVFTDETIQPSVRKQKLLKLLAEQRATPAFIEELKLSKFLEENQSLKCSCSFDYI